MKCDQIPTLAGILFLMLAFIGCGSDSGIEPIDSAATDSVDYLCHPDTLDKWSEWAMRTDEGLWEDDADRSVNLELICMSVDGPIFWEYGQDVKVLANPLV